MSARRILALGLTVAAFSLTGCSSMDGGPGQVLSPMVTGEMQAEAGQLIGVEGGTILVSTGSLTVTPGALSEPHWITFSSKVTGSENRAEIQGVENFLQPCIVTLQMPPAGTPGQARLAQFSDGGKWVSVACAVTNGWAAGTIGSPRPLSVAWGEVID